MENIPLTLLEGISIGSARGRQAKPIYMAPKRELTEADLAVLRNPPALPTGTNGQTLKTLRDTHHLLARLLAEGRKPIEASRITGHSLSRISILKSDPMFCELLAYYQENTEQLYYDVHERLAGLGMNAVAELTERLEEEPEKFGNKLLLEVAEFSLDRSVTPGAKTVQGHQGTTGAAPQITINFVKSNVPPQGEPGQQVIDITPEVD